ncbi:LysR family transcriptional regulator [Amycolatopsis methanolica]|uniref:LysR family transcriptional regulator n=1 Tax=Amycolatopsis methanolica TaxID=1814 RepID=UPI0006865D23|nr:LysR substrate-binding domain-containing protein [Amycolatopsis methanolica]
MDVERRDIEFFLVLAEELHFGRTVELLRVSQARVSQTIRTLERRIGARLFDRTSRRVALTAIGQRLRDEVAPAHRQIQEAFERARAAGRERNTVLRLGFAAPAVADLIAHRLETVRAQGFRVQVKEAAFNDPLRSRRDGDVGALVTLLPEPGVVVHTEPLVLAVAARHPFARKESVSLEDLARDTVLRALWPPRLPWTTPAGRPIELGRAPETIQELFLAVEAGEGISPLAEHATRYFPRPNLAFVPFSDAPPVEWSLAWREETGAVRALSSNR